MQQELIKRILSSLILLPITFFFILKGSIMFILFISICFFIAAYEWRKLSKLRFQEIIGYFFLIFSFFTIYEIRINNFFGFWIFIFILTICIATDLGGYVIGKSLKGPKLTKFSPNKTFSGMVGGFLFSIIASIIFVNYASEQNFFSNWLLFTILISAISQLGDILVSYFKRLSKIKDTGKIIPGHGGLLDRVDGMIFAFPFCYLIILSGLIK